MRTKLNKDYKMAPRTYSGFTNNHSPSTSAKLKKRIYFDEKKLDLSQETLPEYKNVQEWASEFGVICCFCWIPACGATGIMCSGFESSGLEVCGGVASVAI